MRSSVKRHNRAQRVKRGPQGRVRKSLRAGRAEARRANGDRWLADFMGVRPSVLGEWAGADPWRGRGVP